MGGIFNTGTCRSTALFSISVAGDGKVSKVIFQLIGLQMTCVESLGRGECKQQTQRIVRQGNLFPRLKNEE